MLRPIQHLNGMSPIILEPQAAQNQMALHIFQCWKTHGFKSRPSKHPDFPCYRNSAATSLQQPEKSDSNELVRHPPQIFFKGKPPGIAGMF